MVTQTLFTARPVLVSVTVPESDGSTAKAGVDVKSKDAAMRAVASKGLIKRMSVISLLKWLGPGNVAGLPGASPRDVRQKHDIETDFAQCSPPDEALDPGVGVLVRSDP